MRALLKSAAAQEFYVSMSIVRYHQTDHRREVTKYIYSSTVLEVAMINIFIKALSRQFLAVMESRQLFFKVISHSVHQSGRHFKFDCLPLQQASGKL